ncbi:hypothetical protein ACIBO6_11445 [Streptomyces luteogriseus]|uniref:hypothetical protein n=1 Tax=Streptomyces luteogriseus TaxID=68233 RepID=UPI0037AA7308
MSGSAAEALAPAAGRRSSSAAVPRVHVHSPRASARASSEQGCTEWSNRSYNAFRETPSSVSNANRCPGATGSSSTHRAPVPVPCSRYSQFACRSVKRSP